MLMIKSISGFNSSTSLHTDYPHRIFRPLSKPNSSVNLAFRSHEKCKPSVQCLNNTRLVARNDKIKRNWIVRSSVEPGPPTPSGSPNPLSWILGIAIAVLIPFIGQKWGPLKNKFETALNKAEDVVEGIEKMAEKVEKVAEDIADDLPADGQLRRAVDFVEKVAERAAKDAGIIDDIIDEVQEEEEKVESFAESLEDKEKEKEKEKEPAPKAEESETKNT